MSVKKNLGALVVFVVLLLSIYGAIWTAEVTAINALLIGLALALFGIKSHYGVRAKDIEAKYEGEDENR